MSKHVYSMWLYTLTIQYISFNQCSGSVSNNNVPTSGFYSTYLCWYTWSCIENCLMAYNSIIINTSDVSGNSMHGKEGATNHRPSWIRCTVTCGIRNALCSNALMFLSKLSTRPNQVTQAQPDIMSLLHTAFRVRPCQDLMHVAIFNQRQENKSYVRRHHWTCIAQRSDHYPATILEGFQKIYSSPSPNQNPFIDDPTLVACESATRQKLAT